MESEIKIVSNQKVKVCKTPIYVRKAVRDYEQRMKLLYPEKYQMRLEKHREYYKLWKERKYLERQQNFIPIST